MPLPSKGEICSKLIIDHIATFYKPHEEKTQAQGKTGEKGKIPAGDRRGGEDAWKGCLWIASVQAVGSRRLSAARLMRAWGAAGLWRLRRRQALMGQLKAIAGNETVCKPAENRDNQRQQGKARGEDFHKPGDFHRPS